MGSAEHKSSLPMESNLPLAPSVYNFKPFKLISDSYHSRCSCQTFNINADHERRTPKPRSGHRIVCDDINVYSFGGYNPSLAPSDEADLANDRVWLESKPLFKELWKYNVSTALWNKLDVDEIPDILASNAVLLSGHVLMVYGGTGVPFGANCSKNLYICNLQNDPNELRFNLISASGNCPQPQYGQAIVLANHYLYTIGGTTGFEYTCDIHRFNLKDAMWEAVFTCKGSDNEPPGRYRHEVAFHGNNIYVLGGGTAHEAFDFQIIFAFNLSTCKWEKMCSRPDDNSSEAYPAPRRCHSCVQYEQYAYVIGGFSGRLIFKDIWRIDLNTFKWRKIPKFSLNMGTYFHSSCLTSSGKLFTFGGIVQTETSSKRSAAIHTAWLCIPKLKEICWEAVMFYYPNLNCLSEEELCMLGLPYEFIRRLDHSK